MLQLSECKCGGDKCNMGEILWYWAYRWVIETWQMVFLQGEQKECCILKAKGRKCFKNEALIPGVECNPTDEIERVPKPQGLH